MRIDRKLNIIIPIFQGDRKLWIHSTPISRGVFENYALPLAKTFAAIYSQGLGAVAGPRVAWHMLKDIAQKSGDWEGAEGVERGLISEIRRLTNVVMPTGNGWSTVPYQEVFDQKKAIDEDDLAEVENMLVFFTVFSAMQRKSELPVVLGMMSDLWGVEITSSNCTEFAISLPTSTTPANTGETAKQSSIPY